MTQPLLREGEGCSVAHSGAVRAINTNSGRIYANGGPTPKLTWRFSWSVCSRAPLKRGRRPSTSARSSIVSCFSPLLSEIFALLMNENNSECLAKKEKWHQESQPRRLI